MAGESITCDAYGRPRRPVSGPLAAQVRVSPAARVFAPGGGNGRNRSWRAPGIGVSGTIPTRVPRSVVVVSRLHHQSPRRSATLEWRDVGPDPRERPRAVRAARLADRVLARQREG